MTKRENARPAQPLPLVKTDLATLPLGQDVMVWLGHSSPVPAAGGKTHPDRPGVQRLRGAVLFINKAFPGDYPWRAEGMPEIDLLIISHDHYDHLDYATIRAPGNDSNLLIVFYVQIVPDDFVMQLHRF